MRMCPLCSGDPFDRYDSDWMYDNGVWNTNVATEIKCGSCGEKIKMKPFESIDHEFYEVEDDTPEI
jgi:hypothetical protein